MKSFNKIHESLLSTKRILPRVFLRPLSNSPTQQNDPLLQNLRAKNEMPAKQNAGERRGILESIFNLIVDNRRNASRKK